MKDECIIWKGATIESGYGVIFLHGKNMLTHRLALSLKLGRNIGVGMYACHTCDNKLCVNPNHLYEGTQEDNMKDSVKAGTHNSTWEVRVHSQAKISLEDVIEIKKCLETMEVKEVAKKFSIAYAVVYKIKKGQTWAWVKHR